MSHVSNDPWRVVSVGSDEVVVTLAFRDPGDLRQAIENALAANSWDSSNEILSAALSGVHKPHELSGDCCQPTIEMVPPWP